MNNIFIMQLEPIESRYTCEWFVGLPQLLNDVKRSDQRIHAIDGIDVHNDYVIPEATTAGAFLNFASTNIWKNNQINAMAFEFACGNIKSGDKILFTDAWHPGIIQIKYMSELLDIPVEIHAIWHAGSYDPQDFLGRKIKDKNWSLTFEESLFWAIDYNYFATQFHIDMFKENVISYSNHPLFNQKFVRSGQPHNLLVEHMREEYMKFLEDGGKKRDLILFPHRMAPEKQPEIFTNLAYALPQYEWVFCQEQNLDKYSYHKLLFESKIVFSANLQETLGIGAMEAILAYSSPLLPDRLSYSEMYLDEFLYPSEYTMGSSYYENKEKLIERIQSIMNKKSVDQSIQIQRGILLEKYLYPEAMIEKLIKE